MTRTGYPRLLPAFLCLLALSACRSDDKYEPNDDWNSATPLAAGAELQASAGQESPDVFAVEAAAGKTVVFRVVGRAREECPEFAVLGPGEKVLYRDQRAFCGDPPLMAEIQDKSVEVSGKKGEGYELRVKSAAAGKYLLMIKERKRPDNVLPFSWDYTLTAIVE